MKLLEGQYEKKCYLFFGGLLIEQSNWLNKMSEKGYLLVIRPEDLEKIAEIRAEVFEVEE